MEVLELEVWEAQELERQGAHVYYLKTLNKYLVIRPWESMTAVAE